MGLNMITDTLFTNCSMNNLLAKPVATNGLCLRHRRFRFNQHVVKSGSDRITLVLSRNA